MKSFLSLFMKSPNTKEVKTRLLEALPEPRIARLYEAFVQDALDKIAAFSCDVKVVAYWGSPLPAECLPSVRGELKCYPQEGSDLGERMKNYFQWSFSQGAGKSIVIGSDSPTLPVSYLEEAFLLLDAYEVVIGPSLDGGYYLIGMNVFHPELFENISWGTEAVFQETIFHNRHLEGKWALLGPWYDVDTPESLMLLKTHLREMVPFQERGFPQRTFKILSEAEGVSTG